MQPRLWTALSRPGVGHAELLQLPSFGADDRGRQGLAHSRLYDDPDVLGFVSASVERWAVDGVARS